MRGANCTKYPQLLALFRMDCDSSSVDDESTDEPYMHMDINVCFGRNVKTIREQLGWSQEDLAECANLHRTYISGVERGVRNPTLEIVQKLAEALGVSPADLLKAKEEK